MNVQALVVELQKLDPGAEVAIGTPNSRDSMPDTRPITSVVQWDGKAVVMA